MNARANPKLPAALIVDLKTALGEEISQQLDDAFHKWVNGAIERLLRENLKRQNDRSIIAFCRRWGIGRSTFYEMLAAGTGPAMMVVHGRRLISPDAEARWVGEREAAALTTPKKTVGKSRRHVARPLADHYQDRPE